MDVPEVRNFVALVPGSLGAILEDPDSGEAAVKRKFVAGFVGVVAGIVAPLPVQAQEPIREPIAGICVRPLIGEGGLINLPLVDIPGQRIPRESLELTLGGQYRECHVR
jgi:hypothetical protein